jgi:hypothetical protein
MPLTAYAKERIEYVASYVQGSVTDWFRLKRIILQGIPGQHRKSIGMSKRHRSTKKMILNDVDHEVIAYWELITGVKLWIDPTRVHDPSWVSRPKGWALNGGKEKLLQTEAERETNTDSSSDNRRGS